VPFFSLIALSSPAANGDFDALQFQPNTLDEGRRPDLSMAVRVDGRNLITKSARTSRRRVGQQIADLSDEAVLQVRERLAARLLHQLGDLARVGYCGFYRLLC
jgi:hypothetical protein